MTGRTACRPSPVSLVAGFVSSASVPVTREQVKAVREVAALTLDVPVPGR